MELLNSKVNHKDYMCDHTAWGADVCKRVGSTRVKLLYDIYHLQIMEGDICRTIKDNFSGSVITILAAILDATSSTRPRS
jgi:hydroxypyruvate isomerase